MMQLHCRTFIIPAAQRHMRCSSGVHVSAVVSVGISQKGRSRQHLVAPRFRCCDSFLRCICVWVMHVGLQVMTSADVVTCSGQGQLKLLQSSADLSQLSCWHQRASQNPCRQAQRAAAPPDRPTYSSDDADVPPEQVGQLEIFWSNHNCGSCISIDPYNIAYY